MRLFFTQRKTIQAVDTTTGEIDALRGSVLNIAEETEFTENPAENAKPTIGSVQVNSHSYLMASGIMTVALTAIAAFRGINQADEQTQMQVQPTIVDTRAQMIDPVQTEGKDDFTTPTLYQSFPPSDDISSCFPVVTNKEYMLEDRQLCFVETSMEFVYWVPTPPNNVDNPEAEPVALPSAETCYEPYDFEAHARGPRW